MSNWDDFKTSPSTPADTTSGKNSGDKWGSFKSPSRKAASLSGGDYALLGGTGAAAVGVVKWALDPFIEKGKLERKIAKPIRKDFGISKNIKSLRLPDELQNILDAEFSAAEGGVIRDTSLNLVENHSKWRNSAFEKYGQTLDQIDEIMHKSGLGVPVEASSFKENVLVRTIKRLEADGLEKEARAVQRIAKGLKDGDPIQFSQAKKIVTNITKANPRVGRQLIEDFGDFMANDEIVSKTPAGKMFKNLQENYSPFKEIDNLAAKLVDRNTGNLNTQKINTALNQYVRGKGNPQTAEFLKRMGTTSEMTAGVPELAEQSKVLKSVAEKVSKIRDAKITAKNLANQLEGVNSKIKTRLIAAGTTATLMGGSNLVQQFMRLPLGGKVISALPALGVAGQAATAFDAWKLKNEPLQQFQKAMSGATFGMEGKPVPPLVRTNQINQELQQDPTAYNNAIMTPETANYLKLRSDTLKENDPKHWSNIDLRDLFKKKK